MNLFLVGIIIFILIFFLLSWFAKANSKKITKGVRSIIVILSVILAIVFLIGGRLLFSLPLLLLALSILKIKGLTAIQIFQLWRLINYLRSSGRFSYYSQANQARPSSNLSLDEAYKILGIKKGFAYPSIFIGRFKMDYLDDGKVKVKNQNTYTEKIGVTYNKIN